jgi:uncharacterized membrane protein YczE
VLVLQKLFIRFLVFFIGLIILSLGISFTIIANLGTGAWDALHVGLQETFGLTIGTWVIIVGTALIFVNGILFRRRPTFASILTIIIVGVFIDFWLIIVFKDIIVAGNIVTQFIYLGLGIILLPLGIAVYLQGNLAPNPIDQLMLAIQYRFRVNLMVAKTVGELTALIVAWILGGPIGIGTIIITFIIGPLVQLFIPLAKTTANKVLKESLV